MRRGLRRHLDDLVAGRRPRPFRATPDEADELRVALELRAAAPGVDTPREGFADELHRRLAAELSELDGRPAAEPDGRPAAEDPPPNLIPLRPVGRRRLLAQGAGLAAASAAVGAAAGAAVVHGATRAESTNDDTPDASTLTPTAGAWRTVAAANALPEGAVLAFDLGTVAGFVHRDGGVVRAVSASCTHQGCRLRLDAARRLDCPCHTTVFALSGELITHQLPRAPLPLPQFAAREVDGAVQVFAPPPEV